MRGPFVVALCLVVSGGASTAATQGGCGTGPAASTCMGELDVPKTQADSFRAASRLAIDILHTPAFTAGLGEFVRLHAHTGAHAAAWRGFDTAAVIVALRTRIPGLSVETYGGIIGWLKYNFAGNLAFDGTTEGPIRINRWGLPRSPASIANTIVHETAHRVGLHHPSSDADLNVAFCEPPYVIGSIVERIAAPSDTSNSGHCPMLFER